MAIAITLTGIEKHSFGSLKAATATLSFDGDGSTAYTDDGEAMPTGWEHQLGLHTKVLWVGLNGPLTVDDTHSVALLAKVDLDSDKLVLFGTEATTLGNELIELASYTPLDATYTTEILAIGY